MTIAKNTLLMLTAAMALPATSGLSAQELSPTDAETEINVYGAIPADLTGLEAGPEFNGVITAREASAIQIMDDAGSRALVDISDGTEIRVSSGFLDLGRRDLGRDALLTGLPVKVKTVRWEGGLIASEVRFSDEDFEVAQMIRNGTSARFAANERAIDENAAATEALRGRVANIDQYNVKGVTNVYFDTGKWNLTPAAQAELCATARQANGTDNALLLVVGYTDSTGSQEYNQVLSERRAGGVVNYLQQQCGWQPYRMLTPTGMAESDPQADNTTAAGKAQNRRVAVNILVSKAVDETEVASRGRY